MKRFCGEAERGFGDLIVQDGYVYATDGHIMVRTKTDLPEPPTRFKNELGKFYNDFKESEYDFQLPKLIDFEKYKTERERADCVECDGSGEVEWEYKHYQNMFDCPVCGGLGYSRSGFLTHARHEVKIKSSIVNLQLLIKIISFAEDVGKPLIVTSSTVTNLFFKVDKFEILLMCLRNSYPVLEIKNDGISDLKG